MRRKISRRMALRTAAAVASVFLLASLALNALNDAYGANEAANDRLRAGDNRGALSRYRDIQRDHPELAQLSANAGAALIGLQEYVRAVADLDAAAKSPDATVRNVAFYDKGNALFLLQKLADARGAYVDALRADPTDRDAKFNIEVIDLLLSIRLPQQGGPADAEQPGQGQQGQRPQPGQPGRQPGGQTPQGQQGTQGGTQQPGAVNDGTPQTGPSVNQALSEFRRNLTPEQAAALLDALRRDTPGLEGVIEGRPLPRPPDQDPLY